MQRKIKGYTRRLVQPASRDDPEPSDAFPRAKAGSGSGLLRLLSKEAEPSNRPQGDRAALRLSALLALKNPSATTAPPAKTTSTSGASGWHTVTLGATSRTPQAGPQARGPVTQLHPLVAPGLAPGPQAAPPSQWGPVAAPAAVPPDAAEWKNPLRCPGNSAPASAPPCTSHTDRPGSAVRPQQPLEQEQRQHRPGPAEPLPLQPQPHPARPQGQAGKSVGREGGPWWKRWLQGGQEHQQPQQQRQRPPGAAPSCSGQVSWQASAHSRSPSYHLSAAPPQPSHQNQNHHQRPNRNNQHPADLPQPPQQQRQQPERQGVYGQQVTGATPWRNHGPPHQYNHCCQPQTHQPQHPQQPGKQPRSPLRQLVAPADASTGGSANAWDPGRGQGPGGAIATTAGPAVAGAGAGAFTRMDADEGSGGGVGGGEGAPVVMVLGDSSKRNAAKRAGLDGERLQQLRAVRARRWEEGGGSGSGRRFNHFDDGGGLWDCDTIGIEGADDCDLRWEGVGTTAVGPRL